MKKVLELTVQREDRFLLHMIDANVGLNSVYIGAEQVWRSKMRRALRRASELKRIRYFDKDNGAFGLLEISVDPATSRLKARIYGTYQASDQTSISSVVRTANAFRDSSSKPLDAAGTARLLVHEAIACINTEDSDLVDKALTRSKEAAKLQPEYARAWHCIGQCHQRTGDEMAAIESYLQAIKADAKMFRSWMNLGYRFESIDEQDRAMYAYRIASTLGPQFDGDRKLKKQMVRRRQLTVFPSPETHHLLAARMEEIAELEALHFNPHTIPLSDLVREGISHMVKGQWENAVKSLSDPTIDGPAYTVAQNKLAQALMLMGFPEKTVMWGMTHLSRHPRDILAMTTYASALLVLRRDREALSALQKASKIKPIPLVLYIKAVTEDALGLMRQSARTFSRLIVDCAPQCPTQQHYGIRRLQEMAFYCDPVLTHDARSLWRDFGRVSRLSPGNTTAEATFSDPSISPWEQMRMARAQMVSDRRGCVLQVALSHSIGKRRRTDSRLMPGVELMRKMDWAKAVSVFESMLLTNARDVEVRNLAALCLLQLEERAANQKAAVHCNRILKREPRHAAAMLTKAELLFQRARLGRTLHQTRKAWHCDALELLSRAASIDARHPGVLFSKALAEDAAGHPDLASMTFRQFIVVASEELESQLSYARTRLQHLEFWALRP